MKRREFIKYSALLVGVSAFGITQSFYALNPKKGLHVSILKEPYQTISAVIGDLFPPNMAMPSPHSFNVISFFEAVMRDKRVSDERKKTLNDGVKWLNQTTQNRYTKNYYKLTCKQRENILKQISKQSWGDTWIWYVMNYTFEAMLSDPIYGANTNEIGWKWLDYESGLPRPPRVNRYV